LALTCTRAGFTVAGPDAAKTSAAAVTAASARVT
jgi:hypothetical protein